MKTIKALLEQLHPLNRVHNGPDVERGLHWLADWLTPENGFHGRTEILQYPAGKTFNHWTVPGRWSVRRFSLREDDGREIMNLASHPLSVTPGSSSCHEHLSREELLAHLHFREDLPEASPFIFRRLYRPWEKGWGIALPHQLVKSLTASFYQVDIETDITSEPMLVLEYTLPGRTSSVIHLAAHFDHPGQANDSLSGVLGLLEVVRRLEVRFREMQHTFTVLICPEIIGSAAYLHVAPEKAKAIRLCLCANLLGHDAPLAFCRSKNGHSLLDRALQLALWTRRSRHVSGDWHAYPDCGDEISYDAPGLAIPTSTLSRIGEMFPYYHTSLDTPAQVGGGRFEEAVQIMADALGCLERDAVPVRQFVGNPCLSHPELDLYLEYSNVSNAPEVVSGSRIQNVEDHEWMELRHFMDFFLSNLEGRATLLDIAFAARVPFDFVENYARRFAEKGLLRLESALERRYAGELHSFDLRRPVVKPTC